LKSRSSSNTYGTIITCVCMIILFSIVRGCNSLVDYLSTSYKRSNFDKQSFEARLITYESFNNDIRMRLGEKLDLKKVEKEKFSYVDTYEYSYYDMDIYVHVLNQVGYDGMFSGKIKSIHVFPDTSCSDTSCFSNEQITELVIALTESIRLPISLDDYKELVKQYEVQAKNPVVEIKKLFQDKLLVTLTKRTYWKSNLVMNDIFMEPVLDYQLEEYHELFKSK
jgi:hypothetical protein